MQTGKVIKMAEREVKKWITVNGHHVPIYKDNQTMLDTLIFKATSAPSELTLEERKQVEKWVDDNQEIQGTVYRGLDLSDSQVKKLKIGEKFRMEDRLTSFSKDKNIAKNFATFHLNDNSWLGNNGVILQEDNAVGVDISNISKFESEQEILVNNKTSYIITAIDHEEVKVPGYHGYLEDRTITIVKVKRRSN